MKSGKDQLGRLQNWILVEAYKNGRGLGYEALGNSDATPEESDGFHIHRHEIYRRYFRLPQDSFPERAEDRCSSRRYLEVRWHGAVLLCDSVRQLLRRGWIHFPKVSSAKTNAERLRIYGSFLFLTEAGIRQAQWLLLGTRALASVDPAARPCVA